MYISNIIYKTGIGGGGERSFRSIFVKPSKIPTVKKICKKSGTTQSALNNNCCKSYIARTIRRKIERFYFKKIERSNFRGIQLYAYNFTINSNKNVKNIRNVVKISIVSQKKFNISLLIFS